MQKAVISLDFSLVTLSRIVSKYRVRKIVLKPLIIIGYVYETRIVVYVNQ